MRAGAMPAHVVEDADGIVGAAHREDRQAGEVGDHVVAGGLQLRDVRDQLPAAVEDRAAVERGHAGIDVIARGQRGSGGGGLRGEVMRGIHPPSMARRDPAGRVRIR